MWACQTVPLYAVCHDIREQLLLVNSVTGRSDYEPLR